MRYAYSAVHGESRTIWACGDDNSPQALTFDDPGVAKRVCAEANDAEAWHARTGKWPANMDVRACNLIAACN